jgi:hypothetical protein
MWEPSRPISGIFCVLIASFTPGILSFQDPVRCLKPRSASTERLLPDFSVRPRSPKLPRSYKRPHPPADKINIRQPHSRELPPVARLRTDAAAAPGNDDKPRVSATHREPPPWRAIRVILKHACGPRHLKPSVTRASQALRTSIVAETS